MLIRSIRSILYASYAYSNKKSTWSPYTIRAYAYTVLFIRAYAYTIRAEPYSWTRLRQYLSLSLVFLCLLLDRGPPIFFVKIPKNLAPFLHTLSISRCFRYWYVTLSEEGHEQKYERDVLIHVQPQWYTALMQLGVVEELGRIHEIQGLLNECIERLEYTVSGDWRPPWTFSEPAQRSGIVVE